MSIIDDLENQVSTTWDQVTSTGVPAVIAGVEDYASKQLASQAKQAQGQAQAALNQVIASSPPSTGVMASIQGMFTNIGVSTGLQKYGLYIILGGVAFFFVARKL
jgi:hypothetical protein